MYLKEVVPPLPPYVTAPAAGTHCACAVGVPAHFRPVAHRLKILEGVAEAAAA